MSTADKLTYLNNTKSLLKDALNDLGSSIIDNSTFRSYVNSVNDIYDNYPKISGEGTNIVLKQTNKGKLLNQYIGNLYQETTTGKNKMQYGAVSSSLRGGLTVTYNESTGKITCSGTTNRDYPWLTRADLIIPAGTEMTLSIQEPKSFGFTLRLYYSSSSYDAVNLTNNTKKVTFTTQHDIISYGILLSRSTNDTINEEYYIQLESGPDATEFEKFTFGASPNPSFPQQINVVAGTQTITINNTTYPINLGNIELCKIGTYQDKIYKENDKWYLKKNIGKTIINGTETTIAMDERPAGLTYYSCNIYNANFAKPGSECYCDKLAYSVDSIYSNDIQGIKPTSNGKIKIKVFDSSLSTVDLYKAWLSNNNLLVYYVLNTPTTTEITDTDLISSLENMYSENGTTTISVSGNLPVVLHSVALQGNSLNGKKMGALGDSLIYGSQIGNKYTSLYLIAQKNDMTYINYGKNGNPIAHPSNYTSQAMCERYVDMDNDLDYIIVLGGANDYRLNVPIGENSDNVVTTFKGALNILITGLLQKYPNKKILFMTNYNRVQSDNSLGLRDKDYVDAMIEICDIYNIPCFDNYRYSGITWEIDTQTVWDDEGVYLGGSINRHFSPKGYEFLVPIYENILKGL